MNMKKLLTALAMLLIGLSSVAPCGAMDIALDYTYDTFFASHPVAKATLEKAAADISAAITSNLGATTDTNSATSGITTVTFDWQLSFTNPTTGATNTPFDPLVLPANQVRIFTGMQNISGTTLGKGGPGGFGYSQPGFSYNNQNDVSTAVQNAATAITTAWPTQTRF
jgi:hypothetical protein